MPKKSTEEVVPVSFSWWLTLLDGKGRIQDQTLFRLDIITFEYDLKEPLGLFSHEG